MQRSYTPDPRGFATPGFRAFAAGDYFDLARGLFVGRDDAMDRVLSHTATNRPDIVVTGSPGMGKTRFAYEAGQAIERVHGRNWKGFHIETGAARPPGLAFDRLLRDDALSDKSLLILDDIHVLSSEGFNELLDARRRRYPLQLLMTGLPDETTALLTRSRLDPVQIRLAPLTNEETKRLLIETGHIDISKALPPDGLRSPGRLHELTQTLQSDSPVELPTVLGPDGLPLAPDSTGFHAVELAVKGISDDLIARLAQQPELMYELDWRKFEELVAELYERQGYEVELTRGSKDGGVDIYALHRAPNAKFLTVVDVKKHHAKNRVGVELVKQLRSTAADANAHMGVIATTSYFTRGAKAYQQDRQHLLGLQDFVSVHDMLKRALEV